MPPGVADPGHALLGLTQMGVSERIGISYA